MLSYYFTDIVRDIVVKRASEYRNMNEPLIEELDGEEGEQEPLELDGSDICDPVQMTAH